MYLGERGQAESARKHRWRGRIDGEPPQIAELVRNGMAPADVAALVRKAVQANELYIFTHPDMRPPLEMHVDRFSLPIANSVPGRRR